MNAHAVLSIVLSLLALLPSPSIQDGTSLWLGGSLFGSSASGSVNIPSSNQYSASASLNVPLISGSLTVPIVSGVRHVFTPNNNQNKQYESERVPPSAGGSSASATSSASSSGLNGNVSPDRSMPSHMTETEKWGTGFLPPNNQNKMEMQQYHRHENERVPPSANVIPLIGGSSVSSTSNASSSGWNRGNSERLVENGMNSHTSNKEFTYQSSPTNGYTNSGNTGFTYQSPPTNGYTNSGNTRFTYQSPPTNEHTDSGNTRFTHQSPPTNEHTNSENTRFTYQSSPNSGNTGSVELGNRVQHRNENPQNYQQCRDDEFRCKSNECLPYSVKCDNKIDCRDASDEAFCGISKQDITDPENDCVLPEQPAGGHYKLGGCSKPCNKSPGDTVSKNSILTYSCKNNYVLSGNTISVCLGKEWYKPPSCVKMCPALRSTSVDISCSYRGETVSCSERIVPGTRAKLSCKSSYSLDLTNDPAYREITCLEDGLWDRRVFRCLPVCGTSISHGNTLIVNGFEAKVGTFPWHVGIYRKKRENVYEQICAGSLISNNLVVSAAHCFYDESFNRLNDVPNYAVAGGKHYRDWDVDEQYSQKSSVEDIKLSGRYLGARGNFAEDIALVKLKNPFELTTLVRPICMDWDNVYEREQLQAGQSGKVVGWGKNIKGEPTQTLYEIDMPYVPYQQCLSAVPMDFRGFITSDKFCAGHLNGSSVCEGDSGGGLCFKKDKVWYLRGIVSVSPAKGDSCDYNSYVGFTYISYFRDWIREAYVNE